MGVVAYVQTHKTWTALWACFAVFWVIGFGYYCAKLDNVVFDGKPFYMQFRKTRDLPEGRKWPAWLTCPGMGQDAALQMSCEQCGPPPKDERPGPPVCSPLEPSTPGEEHHHLQSCLVYNNDFPVSEGEGGYLSCNLNYTGTSKARIYLFDQQWPIAFENGHPILPNGAVMHTLPQYSRTLLEIAREVYELNNGKDENSFVLLDGENYATPEDNASQSSFLIYYGNYVDRVYTQSAKNITTGYDFWYWIGFLGGVSFFCYSLHSLIYAAISIAFGWKEEEDGFATLA